ncbi:MAG: Uma2 family endonuclease [Oscillospiraceae bacterium]|nr:Uma2 family endonuclease [Oscillospiraceae bacterium]MCL2278695.1 Uma2 family endonuclease [Oscillospiraceae bacterium]
MNRTNDKHNHKDELQTNGAMQVKEALPVYDRGEYYTYADYCSWELEEGERWELIDGKAYKMSAPNLNHQRLAGEFYLQFAPFLKGKKCKVFFAPCDVRLNADTLDDTVVQPDVMVVCDENKLSDGRTVVGAPDLVIEVLSPSNPRHDTLLKYKKYMESGVPEYWAVDPRSKSVNVHILTDGKYITERYSESDKVPVHVLPGFVIDSREVFAELR